MNAIKLLKKQHRDVRKLFAEAESATSPTQRQKVIHNICDQLAVHATIEEKQFYPAAMAAKTEDLLRESVEEHLAVKRILTDLMSASPTDPQLMAKVTVLKEMIQHHVDEEEETLFPRTEKLLAAETLEALGETMEAMAEDLLAKGNPRKAVPNEVDAPAPLPAPSGASKGKSSRARNSTEMRE